MTHDRVAEQPYSNDLQAAFMAYGRNDFAQAREAALRQLKVTPNEPMSSFLYALAVGRLGDEAGFSAAIAKAVEVEPRVAWHAHKDALLRKQGKNDPVVIWSERFREYLRFAMIDAFVVSYPKCGRTWLRFMLGKYLAGSSAVNYLDVFKISSTSGSVPRVEISHDNHAHLVPFDQACPDKRAYQGKAVLFLARDPRDVLCSYFFQFTLRGDRKISGNDPFTGTLSDFIRYDVGGLKSLIAFYNGWALASRNLDRFMIMTYEEMKRDTLEQLKRAVTFLAWPNKGEQVYLDTVEAAKFNKMKILEEKSAFDDPRLKTKAVENPEARKVRRGIVGGYKDYFTPEDLGYVNRVLEAELDDLFSFYKAAGQKC